MIEDAEQKLPIEAELIAMGATVEAEGENSIESWHQYFKEKREKLLLFLDEALRLNQPINCSL